MIRLPALLCCLAWLTGCAHLASDVFQIQRLQQLQSELALISKTGDSPVPSGYVLKVHAQGRLVYSHQVGFASTDMAELIHEETVFELASLSKIFTAVAVMQLQEQGLLDLDQDLNRYLPDLSKAWQGLTVHHLLSHQSGLPDLINRWPRKRLDKMGFEALKAHFLQEPKLQFVPGSQASYSNTNYIFLAELVARVSGKDFGQYLQTHVFEPAGMASSSVFSPWHRPDVRQALSYAQDTKIHGIDYAVLGAINQKSSIKDLDRFLQALLQNKLIRAETLDHMMKPHAVFEDGKRYGYGWFIGQLGGWSAISTTVPAAGVGHTGRLGAYRTAMYFNRERQFQLLMLSNGGQRTEKLMVEFLQKTRDLLE